jgi:hypothetical protein
MLSGVPLETCGAFNKLWNNKFYYELHLVDISTESYYDARIHEYQMYNTKGFDRLCLLEKSLVTTHFFRSVSNTIFLHLYFFYLIINNNSVFSNFLL